MRRRAAAMAMVLAGIAPAVPAPAQGPLAPGRDFYLLAGAFRTGAIDLLVLGPAGTTVAISEARDGALRSVATLQIPPEGYANVRNAGRWSCRQRTRRFVAFAELPEGPASRTFDLRTPSCKRRLALRLPAALSTTGAARVTVRDRWSIGGVRARLCALAPGGAARCRPVVLPAGVRRSAKRFDLTRPGRWRFVLRAPAQRLSATVVVGGSGDRPARLEHPVVLLTGDSMIQTLDALVTDRLRDRVRPVRDARPATGLSAPGFSWPALARRQATRVRPDATLVFVGVTDGFDMTTPAGVDAPCCGEAWVAEYARRALAMMRAYARGGTGKVIWLALPAPRDPDRVTFSRAVNRALRRAAAAAEHVRLVRIDRLLTPGFRYREFMRYRGRRVRVRADDGVHLAVAGARIAADVLFRSTPLGRLR